MWTDDILEQRHSLKLEWDEVRPARGPQGNVLTAYVTLSATVHDCINLQREDAWSDLQSTMGDDARHLLDFIIKHNARLPVDCWSA